MKKVFSNWPWEKINQNMLVGLSFMVFKWKLPVSDIAEKPLHINNLPINHLKCLSKSPNNNFFE